MFYFDNVTSGIPSNKIEIYCEMMILKPWSFPVSLGQCEEPSLPNGGTTDSEFSFGKWVTFECDADYELQGNSSLQCVLGDTPNDCKWSGDIPVCKCKIYFQNCFKGIQMGVYVSNTLLEWTIMKRI